MAFPFLCKTLFALSQNSVLWKLLLKSQP